ncbi:MAG: hypothetical protein DRP01_10690 [Archaeoglobales archaeon]|nr:MAG: hypothetical protein DRP01_10690 [Archaeoglobales archaeon]
MVLQSIHIETPLHGLIERSMKPFYLGSYQGKNGGVGMEARRTITVAITKPRATFMEGTVPQEDRIPSMRVRGD